MREEKWQRKVDALVRLAKDQRGKPEGDLARQKLLLILENHPEITAYEPFVELVRKDLTMKDIVQMHRRGISTDGSWTAGSFAEALAMMQQEYQRRIAAAHAIPRALLPGSKARDELEAPPDPLWGGSERDLIRCPT